MRFYVLPAVDGKTSCINFDHVTNITVGPQTIDLHFVGVEIPMVIPKTTATLSQVAKGMDVSESTKEAINLL